MIKKVVLVPAKRDSNNKMNMISAVVIAKNEAEQIEDCLKSLSWCDELVVIDDYSTDETAKIAQKLRTKVYQHHLDNDFAELRNFGLKSAKGDWVLFIDADERVSKELAEEIQNAIKSNNSDGYYLKRQDKFEEKILKHGETANVRLLRLGKKDKGVWKRKVHETWQIKGKVGELQNPIIHNSHKDLTDFFSKISFYSELHAQQLFSEGKKSSLGKILFFPLGKFIYNWIILLGFLDGTQGFIMAMGMSLHSFLAASRLFLLNRDAKKN